MARPARQVAAEARRLLSLLLVAAALLLAAADNSTCYFTIKRSSRYFATPLKPLQPPPLSVAEIELYYGGAFGDVKVPPSDLTFVMSSSWPGYPATSLYDGSADTFAATANNDPNPSITVTYNCTKYPVLRMALTNRKFSTTGTYNRCNVQCVNRLSAFSVFMPTPPSQVENFGPEIELYMTHWSPGCNAECRGGETFSEISPSNVTRFGQLTSMMGVPTINVYTYTEALRGNCFSVVESALEGTGYEAYYQTYFNALELGYYAFNIAQEPVPVPASRLTASLSSSFSGFGIDKCFDARLSTACATMASSPGPRLVLAGPCGTFNESGEPVELLIAKAFRVTITNRPSSAKCPQCDQRIQFFRALAFGQTWSVISAAAFSQQTDAWPWYEQSTFTLDYGGSVVCFAGTSKVEVRGAAAPMQLADVRVGDELRCLDTTPDMLQPTTGAWCEVMAWAHSAPGRAEHVTLTFTRGGGSPGTLSLSSTHLMFVLTATTPGTVAASVADLGAFKMLSAANVHTGDVIAVQDGAGGFVAAAVLSARVEVLQSGYYLPALSS